MSLLAGISQSEWLNLENFYLFKFFVLLCFACVGNS